VLDALEAQGIEPEIRIYNTGGLQAPGSAVCIPGSACAWLSTMLPCSAATLYPALPPHPTPLLPAVIIACNMSGQAQEALRIYERMLQAGAQPTATTYTALISAYGKNGQLDKALQIFQV